MVWGSATISRLHSNFYSNTFVGWSANYELTYRKLRKTKSPHTIILGTDLQTTLVKLAGLRNRTRKGDSLGLPGSKWDRKQIGNGQGSFEGDHVQPISNSLL
eukprot:gene14121-biopygen3842